MSEGIGTSSRLCSTWQCWDLRDLRGDKPVCTGVSVNGMAEARKQDSAIQGLLHPGVQTLRVLQPSFWR